MNEDSILAILDYEKIKISNESSVNRFFLINSLNNNMFSRLLGNVPPFFG